MDINHPAQLFSNIKLNNREILKVDWVLCYVPYSHDGTIRKNLEVWGS